MTRIAPFWFEVRSGLNLAVPRAGQLRPFFLRYCCITRALALAAQLWNRDGPIDDSWLRQKPVPGINISSETPKISFATVSEEERSFPENNEAGAEVSY